MVGFGLATDYGVFLLSRIEEARDGPLNWWAPPATDTACDTSRMAATSANGGPRAVVFDIGGVLLEWDPRHLYRKLFDDEAEMNRFLAEVCTMEWHHAHDLGVPPEQTVPPLVEAHPEYTDHIWAWPRRSEEMVGGPIGESVDILRALKDRGVPVYALTNMETWTYPGRRDRYPFLQWFDGTVVSGFEGVAKPDPRIYELLLDRFGLRAETTLFVDDSAKNVLAARGVGMQAMRFESPDALRDGLVAAGLLEDPDQMTG